MGGNIRYRTDFIGNRNGGGGDDDGGFVQINKIYTVVSLEKIWHHFFYQGTIFGGVVVVVSK